MVTIRLTGWITEAGTLEVELPPGLPAGAVEVEMTIEKPIEDVLSDEAPLTEAEIADLLKTEPKSGAEIVAEIKAGLLDEGWGDVNISGAQWVEQERQKRRDQSQ